MAAAAGKASCSWCVTCPGGQLALTDHRAAAGTRVWDREAQGGCHPSPELLFGPGRWSLAPCVPTTAALLQEPSA